MRSLLDLIFPPLCHACGEFIPAAGDIHLCPSCREQAGALLSPLCNRCGVPFLTEKGIDHACGDCISDPPPFAAARAAVPFEDPVKKLIHNFKYEHRIQLRRPLALLTAELLAPFAVEAAPDLIIPVPLHVKRLRSRGFNQALLLAELLSKKWRIPLSRRGLRRIRWTEPQIALSATEREKNVKGAFQVHKPAEIAGRRVLLVDDVYTTGSTVIECSRTLKKAGADKVFVVTVARAVAG